MKKLFKIVLILSIISGMSSCNEFLDINHDPDILEDAPVEMILPAALSSPMYILGGDGQIFGAYWAQHWTQSTNAPQYQGYDSWQITNATFDGRGYGALYYYSLKDLEHIRKIAEKEENWTYFLMTTVVEAYIYQVLVDLYDKVPFTEALQGEGSDGFDPNITPKFDDGEFIYNGLIEMLDDALSKNLGAVSCKDPGDADILFGGNMNSWQAFANTLKLKILLRQSNVNDVTTAMADLKGKAFLTSDAAFNIFVNQPDKRNPIYSAAEIQHKGNLSMSRTLMDYLTGDIEGEDNYRDRRVEYLAERPKDVPEYHRALLQGDYLNIDYATSIEELSRPMLKFDHPLYYMTEAESYFLQAEANLRYWGDDTKAEEMYEEGIRAAFDRLDNIGLVPTDDDEYDAEVVIDGYAKWVYTSEEAQLELIWMQKWVSMTNIQGIEAFIEHNRTNTPYEYEVSPRVDNWQNQSGIDAYEKGCGWFTIALNNVTSDRYPRRLMCPQSEMDGNPNVPVELRSKKIFDPVWWDID